VPIFYSCAVLYWISLANMVLAFHNDMPMFGTVLIIPCHFFLFVGLYAYHTKDDK
jgi:hypothetical protein